MIRARWAGAVTCALAVLAGAGMPAQQGYQWDLPATFPPPAIPADNPITPAKVELGRHLFYDVRMSANRTQSCGSCHEQRLAFTDGKARSVGSTGQVHPRGSMSLVNVAYARALTWANPGLTRLEDQALVPMYGTDPVELGLTMADDGWLDAIRSDPAYTPLFAAAFPREDRASPGTAASEPITREHVARALASFQRAIVSARSPYDRYHFDRDETAISDAARRGEILFHSRPLSCFTCHGGIHFSGAMGGGGGGGRRMGLVELHNTGLYNLPGLLSYPAPNTGLYELTRDPKDVGRFKAPTLRNIAVTAPYMHDGSVATLEDAVAHYAAGGRTIATGDRKGIGRDNPNKSDAVRGFELSAEQRADLIAFLRSLTDEALLQDPRFSDPWPSDTRGTRGEAGRLAPRRP